MTYGSVCSGIEGATVAWDRLGWMPAFFAEVDPFCRALLAWHYPEVENLGDFTMARVAPGSIDLLVGGTPCQSFSVAGLRGGLSDPRGNLTLEFLRLVGRVRPRWVVWENVPGVLSIDGGRTFGAVLGALAQLGYGWAYRILDARFFGLAQRRRRVFVVGRLGDGARAAEVLLEPEGMRGHPAPGRAAESDLAPSVTPGARRASGNR
jgi:DNA (cytosine-5)-methyltransferase 1